MFGASIFEAGVPETYNAAPAEYVGQAALCIKLGPEIPSADMSARDVPMFDDRYGERPEPGLTDVRKRPPIATGRKRRGLPVLSQFEI